MTDSIYTTCGRRTLLAGLLLLCPIDGCADQAGRQPPTVDVIAPAGTSTGRAITQATTATQATTQVATAPQLALWRDGVRSRIGARQAQAPQMYTLDLGEAWTPYLFTDGTAPDGAALPNSYRSTYEALARGQYGDDRHGRRAQLDDDLELYGIAPTLGRLRARMLQLEARSCDEALDPQSLRSFSGEVRVRLHGQVAATLATRAQLGDEVDALIAAQQVTSHAQLDPTALDTPQRRVLKRYRRVDTQRAVVEAVQARLRCAGLVAKGEVMTPGVFDATTRRVLRRFERRHRIPLGGRLRGETVAALARTPMEGARLSVVRVLTERAVHTLGVIEDGSSGDAYLGDDGRRRVVPDLRALIRSSIVSAFGLQSPESTLRFLRGLPMLAVHRVVFRGPPLPDYYAQRMDLSLEYDRGDVWYDFPFDAEGKRVHQPVETPAEVRVRVHYRGQDIVLARFPTTIGGWQREQVDGVEMWKYKPSPVGRRIWNRIVSAPVWLPPESTPDAELLKREGRRRRVNRDVVGPSYASAYGLVAAYHRTFTTDDEGTPQVLGDQGIRTHGSANFSSVGRGYSHGCHRMHNYSALRLMSFVLRHVEHHRTGQQQLNYARSLQAGGRSYRLEVDEGGYGFDLDRPLPVTVHRGNILGALDRPIRTPLPKYDRQLAAYVMPDGMPVRIEAGVPLPLAPALDTDGCEVDRCVEAAAGPLGHARPAGEAGADSGSGLPAGPVRI